MSAWMPDATRIPAYRDAGRMDLAAPRVLWIASDLDDQYSAALTAAYANANIRCPHLIVDLRRGEVVQMIPADRRATWVDSEGVQVLVLGWPFPPKGLAVEARSALARVMAWVRSLDVPDFRPCGPPVEGHPKAVGPKAGHYISEGRLMIDPDEPMPEEVDVPEGDEDGDE